MCKFVRFYRRLRCKKYQIKNKIHKINIRPTTEENSKLGKNGTDVENKQAFKKDINIAGKQEEDDTEITWSDAVAAIDFFGFYIFLIIILVITISMFTYAYIVAK